MGRRIGQELVWDDAFDSTFYASALFLNNSDDSQHGPGTYLDRAGIFSLHMFPWS
jgi:hypothetical protein